MDQVQDLPIEKVTTMHSLDINIKENNNSVKNGTGHCAEIHFIWNSLLYLKNYSLAF